MVIIGTVIQIKIGNMIIGRRDYDDHRDKVINNILYLSNIKFDYKSMERVRKNNLLMDPEQTPVRIICKYDNDNENKLDIAKGYIRYSLCSNIDEQTLLAEQLEIVCEDLTYNKE